MVALAEGADADGVLIIQFVGAVRLQRIGDVLLVGVLRLAVEEQIPDQVGDERQARVPCGCRALDVEGAVGVLPADHREVVDFTLILIERLAGVGGLAVDRERRAVGIQYARCHAPQVRDLERAGGGAERETQPVGLVEDVLHIGKAMRLPGVVMKGIGAAVGRLDAEIAVQEIARDEVVEVSRRAAVVEARVDLAVAAAVERNRAARDRSSRSWFSNQ